MDSASKRFKDNPSFSSSLLDEIYRSIDQQQQTKFERSQSRNICFQDDHDDDQRHAYFIHNKTRQKPVTGRRSAADLETNSMRYTSFRLNSSSTSSSDIESVHGIQIKPRPIRTAVYQHDKQNDMQSKGKFVKTKSKALKIYSDLKKVKQPISPGGRLAAFLNSLFTNKKHNDSSVSMTDGSYTEAGRSHLDRKSKSANASRCSSTSSFSRSCLSNTPSSRGKLSNGIKRSVTFYPVDEHKSMHKEEMNLKSNKEVKLNLSDKAKNRHISEAARNLLKSYQKKVESGYDNLSDDGGSDSSSDLFELDNLSVIGMHGYREELPVYETTRVDTSRLFM
ncbi:protein BIG GRAIN 1-like B [Bidens hawaiensis]|uniref:protein BIG GRAIN 1-like B n=1 Tax=Bidens hawaiensis TaxID=980011 RepID=UPI00404B7A08